MFLRQMICYVVSHTIYMSYDFVSEFGNEVSFSKICLLGYLWNKRNITSISTELTDHVAYDETSLPGIMTGNRT
jgi:hypothetical protein